MSFQLQNTEIPYSQIIKYLTSVQRRNFQSLNKTSKKLLLANIHELSFTNESVPFLDTFLYWIRHNAIYLTGIVEINIFSRNPTQFLNIINTLSLLEYKNINKIKIIYYFNVLNPESLKQFFLKISNVQIIEISNIILFHVLDVYTFKYIRVFVIHHSINEIFDSIKFNLFFRNNEWKYLQEINFTDANTNILSLIFKNLVFYKCKIQKIHLFFSTINYISDEMKLYLESDLVKKVKFIEIFNQDEVNYEFLNFFLTQYIQIINCNSINDLFLKKIGDNCSSLIELKITNSLYTQQGFINFLKKNKLSNLKIFQGNLNYFLPINIHKFLPNLEEISIDPFINLMNEQNTKNFLIAMKDLKSLEFSSIINYKIIIPFFQNYKNLESLYFLTNEISLSQLIFLMNLLNLHKIKFLSLNLSEFSLEMIAPFLKNLINLQEIQIIFNTEGINRIMIEMQIMSFLNIIKSLEFKNPNLHTINLIANINNKEINIPNHKENFLELWEKFPNLKNVQLGWGNFIKNKLKLF